MRLTGRLVERFERTGVPARSVRLRLTALYGGLFLVGGAGLLVITYLLVSHSTRHRRPGGLVFSGRPFAGLGGSERTIEIGRIAAALGYQNRVDLHQLLIESAIALALMAALSVALGWVVAGRVLSPLRTITARTRRISKQSQHERLALSGPRDELKELADTIDELLVRLEAAFDAQRRFVSNASHELRTPLAMMRTRLGVAVAKQPRRRSSTTVALDLWAAFSRHRWSGGDGALGSPARSSPRACSASGWMPSASRRRGAGRGLGALSGPIVSLVSAKT